MVTEKRRLHYIDIAKGIGIILVVMGHTTSDLNNFMDLFHVPLFFFLSGMFHNEANDGKPLASIKKKIKGLYFPYVRYGLFFILALDILSLGGIYITNPSEVGFDKLLHSLLLLVAGIDASSSLTAALWFLISLLIISTLFILIRFCMRKLHPVTKELITLFLAFIFLYAGFYADIHLIFGRSLVCFVFYYFGFLFFKYKEYVKFNVFFGLIALAILVYCSTKLRMTVYFNLYSHKLYLVPVALVGIYLVLCVSKLINKNKVLEYIGQNTIVILALHFLAFKVITVFRIYFMDLPAEEQTSFFAPTGTVPLSLLYTFAGVAIPLLLQRIGFMAKDKIISLFEKE